MSGIMLITHMHFDFIGTSTKWCRAIFTNEESEAIVVKNYVQFHPAGEWSWDLSQWPPWFSDSKTCELGNTTHSSRIEPAPVSQATRHIGHQVTHLPPESGHQPIPLLLWFHQFSDNFSMSPAVLRIYLIFVSLCYASMFPLLSTSSLFSVSHVPALQGSIPLCSRAIYSHRFLVWAVQHPTPVNAPISFLGNLSLCTDVEL